MKGVLKSQLYRNFTADEMFDSRYLRVMRQGEFHQGVAAMKIELFTDVAAMRFDSVVTDE